MGVSIEWIVGIIRGGEEHEEFGDPYTFSVLVLKDRETAILKGATNELFIHARSTITKLLKDLGVKMVKWETHQDNGSYLQTEVNI